MKLKDYIPFYQRNLLIAIPVVLSQAGQVMVQLADNMMVGHVGTRELAAASFGGSVFINGLIFGMGFSFGLTPLVGRAFGQSKFREAANLFQNSIAINIIMGFILMAVMYGISFFMDRMGQPEDVVSLAIPYYRILVLSMLPFLLFFSFKQFAEGIGNTKVAMFITLAANLVNIILNYIFIFGKFGMPALGLEGAGYATLISRIIMPLIFLYWFVNKTSFRRYFYFFDVREFRRSVLMKLSKVSLPIGVQMLIEVLAFSLGAIMMGWLGEVPLAAHQIALSLASFTFMLATGVASGTTIRVAHQFGSKRYQDMRHAVFASLHMILVFMSFTALSFVLFRNFLPQAFVSDPEVIKVAASLLIIAAIFQISDGLQVVALASLRGLADVKVPMYYAFLSYIVISLPISYLFAFTLEMGPIGIWFGYVSGLSVACVLFLTRFNRLSREMIG
ncbi:MAG: MATE family efflux transporter [Bacteroidales bacterium]|nr:MATE family efflux transporter [Bacteroidales bacterium]